MYALIIAYIRVFCNYYFGKIFALIFGGYLLDKLVAAGRVVAFQARPVVIFVGQARSIVACDVPMAKNVGLPFLLNFNGGIELVIAAFRTLFQHRDTVSLS